MDFNDAIQVLKKAFGGGQYDESKHPRHPKGTKGGGRFAPKQGGSARANASNHPLQNKKWQMTAGGTAAAPDKHAYHIRGDFGLYTIDPVSSMRGKHIGYSLRFANEKGRDIGHSGLWHSVDPSGYMQNQLTAGTFRSPQDAMSAARQHYNRYLTPGGIGDSDVDPRIRERRTRGFDSGSDLSGV